jgi:hypothetical protein
LYLLSVNDDPRPFYRFRKHLATVISGIPDQTGSGHRLHLRHRMKSRIAKREFCHNRVKKLRIPCVGEENVIYSGDIVTYILSDSPNLWMVTTMLEKAPVICLLTWPLPYTPTPRLQ